MKTQCEHCKERYKAPDEYEGRKYKCPKCDKAFIIKPISNITAQHAIYINDKASPENVIVNKQQENSNDTIRSSSLSLSPKVKMLLIFAIILLIAIPVISGQIQKKLKNAQDQKQKEIVAENEYVKEKDIAVNIIDRCVYQIDSLVLSVCVASTPNILSQVDTSPSVIYGQFEENATKIIDVDINSIKIFINTYPSPPKKYILQHKQILEVFDLLTQYYKMASNTNESLYRYKRLCVTTHNEITFVLKEQLSKAGKLTGNDKIYDEYQRTSTDAINSLQLIKIKYLLSTASINGNTNQIRFLESLKTDLVGKSDRTEQGR